MKKTGPTTHHARAHPRILAQAMPHTRTQPDAHDVIEHNRATGYIALGGLEMTNAHLQCVGPWLTRPPRDPLQTKNHNSHLA